MYLEKRLPVRKYSPPTKICTAIATSCNKEFNCQKSACYTIYVVTTGFSNSFDNFTDAQYFEIYTVTQICMKLSIYLSTRFIHLFPTPDAHFTESLSRLAFFKRNKHISKGEKQCSPIFDIVK